MIILNLILAAGVAVGPASPAAAQPREPRAVVSINAGVQPASNSLSDRLDFRENVEDTTADVSYPSRTGVAFDGGIGVRVWKRFGAGLAVSHFSREGPAHIDAKIPHPFFFDRPRTVTADVDGLARTETGVHLQVLYLVRTTGRMRLALSAGPSRIEAEQELVTAVQYNEEYPFDTATFRSASRRTSRASSIGFNAGFDAAYMFTRQVGLGAVVRFSRATVKIARDDARISMDIGGLQAGGGLRILF